MLPSPALVAGLAQSTMPAVRMANVFFMFVLAASRQNEVDPQQLAAAEQRPTLGSFICAVGKEHKVLLGMSCALNRRAKMGSGSCNFALLKLIWRDG